MTRVALLAMATAVWLKGDFQTANTNTPPRPSAASVSVSVSVNMGVRLAVTKCVGVNGDAVNIFPALVGSWSVAAGRN